MLDRLVRNQLLDCLTVLLSKSEKERERLRINCKKK